MTARDVSDSMSVSPVFLVETCLVCSDKVATGRTDGAVATCESCKGFFVHSLWKKMEYCCSNEGNCIVTRFNRNRCLHCRLKKCLAVGAAVNCRWQQLSDRCGCVVSIDDCNKAFMSAVPRCDGESDTLEPAAGGSCVNEGTAASKNSHLENLEPWVIDGRQYTIYNLILSISFAYSTTHERNDHETAMLYSLATPTAGVVQMALDSKDYLRCQMFQNLAVLITPSIKRIINFLRHIPDFDVLVQDDQLALIKMCFFEMWLLNFLSMFNVADSVLVFGDGSRIPFAELEIVYSPSFIKSVVGFVDVCHAIRFNDTETGLFTGLVLTAPLYHSSIVDVVTLKRIHMCLVEALRMQISRHRSDRPQTADEILSKIPNLYVLGRTHNDHLLWFRCRWNSLRLPPLFAEIFDIPKSNGEQSAI